MGMSTYPPATTATPLPAQFGTVTMPVMTVPAVGTAGLTVTTTLTTNLSMVQVMLAGEAQSADSYSGSALSMIVGSDPTKTVFTGANPNSQANLWPATSVTTLSPQFYVTDSAGNGQNVSVRNVFYTPGTGVLSFIINNTAAGTFTTTATTAGRRLRLAWSGQ